MKGKNYNSRPTDPTFVTTLVLFKPSKTMSYVTPFINVMPILAQTQKINMLFTCLAGPFLKAFSRGPCVNPIILGF